MADLTQQEWTSQLTADKNAVILDVRTPDEVAYRWYYTKCYSYRYL